MKNFKYFITIFIAIFCISFSYANDDEQLMLQADSAYQQENYEQAIQAYSQIIANGNQGARLFYNLGNSYYKIGQNAQALLWYERARRLAPADEDIQHNIAFVNQKITDKLEPVPEIMFVQWWHRVCNLCNETQWAIFSIVASFLLFIGLIAFFFSDNMILRVSGTIIFWLSAIVLIFSIIFASQQKNKTENNPEAIIMDLVVEAQSTPNGSGNTLFVIHEGLKVQITNKMNGWMEIRLPNGEKGWVPETVAEAI